MKISLALAPAGLALASLAQAQVNGAIGTKPYAQYAVQAVPTNYGDSTLGQQFFANGSELDSAYAYDSVSNINILLAGNLQSNNNRLVVFIDTGDSSGVNTIPNSGPWGSYNGLRFDNVSAGVPFTANFGFVVGLNNSSGATFYVDGGSMTGGASGFIGSNSGTGVAGQNGGILTGGSVGPGIRAAINNSNTSGVTGSSGTGGGSVTTGFEISIPWSYLGVPQGTTMHVTAFIADPAGGSNTFISNQVLGAAPSSTSLGNSTGVNLANLSGNQFFTIPTPGSIALVSMAGLVAMRRRR